MTYQNYWVFALIPVLILIAWKKSKPLACTIFSNLKVLESAGTSWRVYLRKFILFTSSIVTIVCLILASSRPQDQSSISTPESARNLMLAMDISGSMRTRDFSINYQPTSRLEAVKYVIKEFIAKRPNERLGLVVFGSNAFLECPLTSDHALLSDMIAQLEVGLAGDGTALGDGLGVAIKRVSEIQSDSKAVILLTDGVNTAGSVDPLQASKIAKSFNIKVHTIGIGSSKTANSALRNPFVSGGTKQFEFDEKLLRQIAETTGGVYFNAEDIDQLQNVYSAIDQLEKSDQETPNLMLNKEYFYYYAVIALISYVIYLLTNHLFFPRYPW